MISTEYGNELKSITKNAGIGIFGIAFMNIMAFVNNAIITRALGADSYGLFVLATNVFGFIVIIPQLGFRGTIIRYVSYYTGKGENSKAKGSILFGIKLLIIISLIVLLVSLYSSRIISEQIFERPDLTPLLRIIFLSLPFSVISIVLFSGLNGLKLIKQQVIASKILNPLIFFVLISLLFVAGYKLSELIWVMLLMAVINTAIALYFLNKKYFKQSKKIQPDVEKRKLLSFALPLYLNQFLNSAINFAPIFIMGYFLSNKDLGIYNVGFKIAMLVSVSMGAFGLIFSPTISGLFAKNNKLLINQLYKTITKWIFTISLITFSIIILFSDTILSIFGNEFTSGINVLIILIVGELVNAGVGLAGSIIVMSGRSKVALFNAGLNFLTILSLCYILIPEYGIIGAAFSYAITIIFVSIIRLIELYYYEKIHPFKLSYYKPLCVGVISFSAIYYAKNYFEFNNYFEMIWGTVIFLFLFILLLWLFKLDNEDKFVLGLISKKFKKMKIKNNRRVSPDGFIKKRIKSNKYIYTQLLLSKYAFVNKTTKRKRKGNILMLHNGRVGSTVLADLLNQHSNIHWDGELYIEQDKYSDSIFRDPLRLLEIKMNQFSSQYYGFELKAMNNQHPKTYLKMNLVKYITEISKLKYKQFIILKRRNYLRQIISFIYARERKIFHTDKPPKKREKIVLDINIKFLNQTGGNIIETFKNLDEYYSTLEKTLEGYNVLNLTYEDDIQSSPLYAYRKICDFLSIEDEKPMVNLQRTNPFKLDEIIENYDEVVNILKNTKYEWMLEN